ncbi:hypothetical protein HDU93_001513 [Gonapodya sp. JEL0774]|nr:hypothetical protein HDU93_001513 [Gonapodya sp. JEL0774]
MDDFDDRRGYGSGRGRGRGRGGRSRGDFEDDDERPRFGGGGSAGGGPSFGGGGRPGGSNADSSDKRSNYQFRQGLTFEYQRPKFLQNIVGLAPAGPTIEDKLARVAGIEKPDFDAEDEGGESRPVGDDERPQIAEGVGGLSPEEVERLMSGGAKMTDSSRPSKPSDHKSRTSEPASSNPFKRALTSAVSPEKRAPSTASDQGGPDQPTKMVFKKPEISSDIAVKRAQLKRPAAETDRPDGLDGPSAKPKTAPKKKKTLLSFDVED